MIVAMAGAGVTRIYRIYRMKWRRRAFPVLFLAFSLMMGSGLALKWIEGEKPISPMKTVVILVFVAAGALLVMESFTEAVILRGASIEVRRLFSRKALPFGKIRGRREFEVRGTTGTTRYLRLEPNDHRFPALEFEKAFNFDEAYYRWFNAIPDLDASGNGRPNESGTGRE